MLITVQPDHNWQLSLAQLSPSLFTYLQIYQHINLPSCSSDYLLTPYTVVWYDAVLAGELKWRTNYLGKIIKRQLGRGIRGATI